MTYSILLLAATYLAGGAPDDATSAPQPKPAVASHKADPCCNDNCCPDEHCCKFARLFAKCGDHACGDECCRPTLRERLHRLFGRRECSEPCCTGGLPVIKSDAPPLAPPPAKPMPAVKTVDIRRPSPSTEINKEYLDRVGNAPDYSWVTGELFYIHADKGLWVVRYAPVDREDRYGGSVVLAPATSMDAFQEGDLVTVQGEMLYEGRASKYLGGPLYRSLGVSLVDRRK
jgi:hypothetical protein